MSALSRAGSDTSPMSSAAAHDLTVPTPDGPMPAYRWNPPNGTGPGLLLLQEIFGVSPYIRSRAADLAELGYVVVAPEVYWRLDGADIDESRPDYLEQAMGVVSRLDWQRAVDDCAAALDLIRGLDEVEGGAGVIGFCFGGGLAFNLAAVADPDVLVCYYGSALSRLLDLSGQVVAPALYHFGSADDYIPVDTVEAIRTAVGARPGAEFHTYKGANHAFDNPRPEFHHEQAAAEAWKRTVDFLAANLPTKTE